MDAIGVEIRKDSWLVTHLRTGLFGERVRRFFVLKGDSDRERALALKEYMEANSLGKAPVAVALQREDSVGRALDVPAPDKNALAGVMRFEMERHLPSGPEGYCQGFSVIDRVGGVFKVFLSAARKARVEETLECVREAGAVNVTAVPWHGAIYNSLYRWGIVSGGRSAFISMKEGLASLDVFSGGVPVYSRSIRTDGMGAGEKRALMERELRLSGSLRRDGAGPEGVFVLSPGQEEGIDSFEDLSGLRVRVPAVPDQGMELTGAVSLGAALSAIGRGFIDICFDASDGKVKNRWKDGLLSVNALAAVAAALLLSVGLTYPLRDWLMVRKINSELALLKEKRDLAIELSEAWREASERLRAIETIDGKRGPGPLDVLKELSEVLPRDAYLTGFEYEKDVVTIEGFSGRASSLVLRMEGSGLLYGIEFTGPVVRDKNGKERFRLRFRVKDLLKEAPKAPAKVSPRASGERLAGL